MTFGAGEDLTGTGEAAQAGREIECTAAIAFFDRHRLAGVDADPDAEGMFRLGLGSVKQTGLKIDRRSEGSPGGVEDDQRLVPSELEQPPAVSFDDLPGSARRTWQPAGLRLRRPRPV